MHTSSASGCCQDQTRPRRKQRRGKEDGQKGDLENELENKQARQKWCTFSISWHLLLARQCYVSEKMCGEDSKRDRRRRRRKGHEESGCGDSDEKEVDQEAGNPS